MPNVIVFAVAAIVSLSFFIRLEKSDSPLTDLGEQDSASCKYHKQCGWYCCIDGSKSNHTNIDKAHNH